MHPHLYNVVRSWFVTGFLRHSFDVPRSAQRNPAKPRDNNSLNPKPLSEPRHPVEIGRYTVVTKWIRNPIGNASTAQKRRLR